MFELNTGADTVGLQSLAEMTTLGRWGRHWRSFSSRKNVCLVTANHSLNDVGILNILNDFGGF